MDWFTGVVVIGMAATLVFTEFLLKEFRKSIKESKEGRVSGRCNLD